MNKGFLGGFISSDIKESEVKCKDGTTMKKAQFSIACQRKGKNAGADFVFVTALSKNAENIIRFFEKGKGISVTYHVQTGSYQNKEGKTIYTEDKIIDEFEFPYLRKKDEQEEITPQGQPQQQTSTEQKVESDASSEGFMDVPDDDVLLSDLPFRK